MPDPQRKLCEFFRANGLRCRSWAQKDERWCFGHNPDKRAQKRAEDTKRMNARGSRR